MNNEYVESKNIFLGWNENSVLIGWSVESFAQVQIPICTCTLVAETWVSHQMPQSEVDCRLPMSLLSSVIKSECYFKWKYIYLKLFLSSYEKRFGHWDVDGIFASNFLGGYLRDNGLSLIKVSFPLALSLLPHLEYVFNGWSSRSHIMSQMMAIRRAQSRNTREHIISVDIIELLYQFGTSFIRGNKPLASYPSSWASETNGKTQFLILASSAMW